MRCLIAEYLPSSQSDLKQCLDSLRTETEKQAAARVKLALEIKRDVEVGLVKER